MQNASLQCTEIEPFNFKNRSTYRDLLRLLTSVREFQKKAKTDLGQKFLGDFFNALFFITKNVAYSTIADNTKIIETRISKVFDCLTALDLCFEAQWIPSVQYFEAKQILGKTYWTFKDKQKIINLAMNKRMNRMMSTQTAH